MKKTTPKNAQKRRAMLNRLKKRERHRIKRRDKKHEARRKIS